MIAIRTPLLVTMCINSGLNTVKKNYELQDGDCTHTHKTRGTYQENMDTLSKMKTVTGPNLPVRNQHEEGEFL